VLINRFGGTLTNDISATLTNEVGGELSNAGTLTNEGDLTNAGTFNIRAGSQVTGVGTITQSAGALTVNGDMTQSTVNINGGTLAGNGTITSTVTVNSATLSAGATPLATGTLNIIGDLGVLGASTLMFELAGPSSYDMIDVFGIATIADGTIFDVVFLDGYAPTGGSIFDLLIADSFVADLSTFTFDFADAAGVSWTTSLFTFEDSNQSIRLTASAPPVSAVPLPATLPLMLAGVACLGWVSRRRKRLISTDG
jgi:hypothetical protein